VTKHYSGGINIPQHHFLIYYLIQR